MVDKKVRRVKENRLMSDIVIGRDMTSDQVISLSLKSRFNGFYVIGKQGRGKTNFLLSLIIQDLFNNLGLCVLDPHGDLIVDILGCIPAKREHDVMLLDLQDTAHPFAFDLFAGIDPTNPASLTTGRERVVAVFKKTWGDSSWGPRLEDLLSNSVLTLLSNPGTTLSDFPDLLTDASVRERLVSNVASPVVRAYWEREYP